MSWFSTDTRTYIATAQHQGWFGWSKITERVTGRYDAEQLADKWQRRGDRDVRISGGGWFS